MALGRRRREEQAAWVATTDLPRSPGHVFYRKLNQLMAEADFDTFVEEFCRERYADEVGRRGIPPGITSPQEECLKNEEFLRKSNLNVEHNESSVTLSRTRAESRDRFQWLRIRFQWDW